MKKENVVLINSVVLKALVSRVKCQERESKTSPFKLRGKMGDVLVLKKKD